MPGENTGALYSTYTYIHVQHIHAYVYMYNICMCIHVYIAYTCMYIHTVELHQDSLEEDL